MIELEILLEAQEARLNEFKEEMKFYEIEESTFSVSTNIQIIECEYHIGLTKIAIESLKNR